MKKDEPKPDARLVKLEMSTLATTLKRLETKIDNIDHVVRGNGAPGLREIVTVNAARIASLEEGVKEKVSEHRNLVNAIYATAGALMVGVITIIITHFVK